LLLLDIYNYYAVLCILHFTHQKPVLPQEGNPY